MHWRAGSGAIGLNAQEGEVVLAFDLGRLDIVGLSLKRLGYPSLQPATKTLHEKFA